ncbi:hypothetical protein, partial [Rhizobium metallidurans]
SPAIPFCSRRSRSISRERIQKRKGGAFIALTANRRRTAMPVEYSADVSQITDYFAERDAFKNNKASAVQGATLLNDKNDNVILKSVAPMAHDDADLRTDLPVLDDKALAALPATGNALAASATTPDKHDAPSLCSSAPDDKSANLDSNPADDDDPTLLDEQAQLVEDDTDPFDMFDPDFYKVRVDFFDNGVVQNKSRYTAKLTILVHPDSTKADEYILIANFYSRARDFRSKVKSDGMWGPWYDDIEKFFDTECDEKRDYLLKPQIAILKEKATDELGRTKFKPVAYTAAVIWHENGKPPVVVIMYQNFTQLVKLDKAFKAAKKSALQAIGVYRDEARAHLEPKTSNAGMLVRDRNFFGK